MAYRRVRGSRANRTRRPEIRHFRPAGYRRSPAGGKRLPPLRRSRRALFLVVIIRDNDIHGGTDDLGAHTYSGGTHTDCRRADTDGRISDSHYGATGERRGKQDGHQVEETSVHGHRLADRGAPWSTTGKPNYAPYRWPHVQYAKAKGQTIAK